MTSLRISVDSLHFSSLTKNRSQRSVHFEVHGLCSEKESFPLVIDVPRRDCPASETMIEGRDLLVSQLLELVDQLEGMFQFPEEDSHTNRADSEEDSQANQS